MFASRRTSTLCWTRAGQSQVSYLCAHNPRPSLKFGRSASRYCISTPLRQEAVVARLQQTRYRLSVYRPSSPILASCRTSSGTRLRPPWLHRSASTQSLGPLVVVVGLVPVRPFSAPLSMCLPVPARRCRLRSNVLILKLVGRQV